MMMYIHAHIRKSMNNLCTWNLLPSSVKPTAVVAVLFPIPNDAATVTMLM